ncbi:MAG: S-methyl-5-thioribose-1-phosphate isomerase [Clostridiaceae bacterium]|jgi:methylthioribose-1-phosphate isomerase|nr:S-methyl-5-thioribose-1-phosphate isomerase [Clostridia bacterium]MBP6950156.1 S-methyl-5-thioribose-1-phosphate isomerase [Clostridia bacterium]NMA35442.1 S-methyl-5-thioribose-1-phosphate isomerase [Clostridiaceae bacterium]
MSIREIKHLDSVRLSKRGNSVVIIDQTRLPNETVYLDLKDPEDLYEAIHQLRVRGAPAIGIFAGYALYCLALQSTAEDYPAFMEEVRTQAAYLNSSRPTAVNLSWALKRMVAKAEASAGKPKTEILQDLKEECIAIHNEDIAMCKAIAEYGLTLIKDGDGILTHCNAGPLATSRYGTALGPILLGYERGMDFHVFVDETRPLLQGARLTSYELEEAGVDITLICDNMASIVMSKGWVQACFVGCDRVAANGDTANKIGTSGVAILAKYYDIPFYVLGPTSTIDLATPTGADIEIELRDPNEIKEKWYEKPMVLPQTRCYNPAFDVTPHELIDAIVTDRGICRAPYTESLKALFE